MKSASILQTKLNIVREWLFIALLACAPFSFNPSISTPAYGFVSFRVGLYQLLTALFVLVMLPVLWQIRRQLVKDPVVLLGSVILIILAAMSPFRSLSISRSALLSSSFILLVMLLLSGWAFAKTQLTKDLQHTMFRAIVIMAAAVAGFSLLQFAVNVFRTNTLGLCINCRPGIFGFPRVNGFAAEPQFFANSLLAPILLVYGYLLRQKSGIRSYIIFGFLVFTMTLTLSRGSYIALIIGYIALTIILLAYKKLRVAQFLKVSAVAVLACLLGFGTMIGAATVRYHKATADIAPATFATIVEHLSGGHINLPYNDPKPVAGQAVPAQQPVVPAQPSQDSPTNFQSPGALTSSQADRESAASLGIKWWRKDKTTMLLGLGVGNLGSYAHDQNPLLPLSFTIYVQYIFMLVEIGLVGILAFVALGILAIVRTIKLAGKATTTFGIVLAAILISFAIQYCFFGTYINATYIWLYTGLGLGLAAVSKSTKKSKAKA